MTLLIVKIVGFLVFSLTTYYFFYRVVPMLGQRATLCLLHNRRDQLYDLIGESQFGERSLIYQDMLFVLTLLIHMVRDMPRSTTIRVVFKILDVWGGAKTMAEAGWRSKRYDHEAKELFAGEVGQAELRGAMEIFRRKNLALSFYVFTSHPIYFISFLLLSALVAPGVYYYRLLNDFDVRSIEKTLDSIRMYQNRNSVAQSYG